MRQAICLLFATTAGCASPMSALRADNHRLTATVGELRVDRRAQDRKIRDLENQVALLKEKDSSGANMPQLPIEVVAPPAPRAPTGSDPRVVGIADDGAEIVYEGDAALGKVATIDDDFAPQRPIASARVATTSPEPGRRSAPVSARTAHAHVRADRDAAPANDSAGAEYRAAVELVKAGKHDEAVSALRAFIKAYPNHDYADNAQYWLGETYYAQKDYQHALLEFRATIETYPSGNKVPDALLKVGYCYHALGQTEKARAVMEQVVNLYPKTEPAALASKRLETP